MSRPTPRAWRMLALVSVAELLGMSLRFTASALGPRLRHEWGLTTAETAGLTTTERVGFVEGSC